MWPQALQMTRDECRGILRRLELESYSQVISVFRAQGGLSDAKAKLLEELRGIFHISSERHRAEARRVANDEQLATIAEAISGPNTWQEWSREGRRPYPMLPRVAPQTALALISNKIAEETASENAKLPYPAETGEAVKEDQQQQQLEKQQRASEFLESNSYNVVTSDPFKVPKIPASTKKNLKRNIHEQHQAASSGGVNKKRAISDNSLQKNNHHHNAHKQHYPHITANSPGSGVSAGMTNIGERKQQQTTAQQQHLQKQRFFHHQQQLTKQKMTKKSVAAAAAASGHGTNSSTTNKRQATPAKSGRRANQKMLMEQKLALKKFQMAEQQQQQQQQSATNAPTHIDLTLQQQQPQATTAVAGGPVTLTQQQLDLQFVSYAVQQNQPPQQIFMDEQQTLLLANAMTPSPHMHALTAATGNHPSVPTVHIPPTLVTPLSATSSSMAGSSAPQIAVSKRDISKNLNKLQLQQNQFLSNVSPAPNSPSIVPSAHEFPPPNIGTIISTPSPTISVPVGKASEKSLISTTPVQKYIVEERQPVNVNIPTSLGSIVNLQNSVTNNVTSIVQVSTASNQQQPQILTLPQFSAAATKLRAVNTTIIAPGNKMSPNPASSKKIAAHSSINAGALHELANVASTQSQVLHIVDQQTPANNPTNQNQSFNSPLHTPPAVIRIQNNQQAASTTEIPVSCAQGGVLTTKIMPLVLAGSSASQSTTTTSASMVIAGSTPNPTVSTTSLSSNIIKNLPSTVVLNTSTSNLTPVTVTGTVFSTLGAGATVFRKPPNILKTTPVQCSASNTSKSLTSTSSSGVVTSSAGPHIISNVKLTPVNVSSSTVGSTSTFKNVLPTNAGGMMRTSVKICHSPNGKVVIQPAGLRDSSKMKTLPHKIFTNTSTSAVTGSSTVSVGGGVGSAQRIAIQKVQIIPAPLGSPSAVGNALQSTGNIKTSTLAGKSNMIFMPSSQASNVRPVTLSKMGSNLLFKSTATGNAQLATASDSMAAKTNIVLLGQSGPIKETLNHQNIDTNTSLLAEDNAPLDILNMPIVMEPGVGVVSSAAPETVTVLSSSGIIENNNNMSTNAPITIIEQGTCTSVANQSNTVILDATDWEMELDQVITTAANISSVGGVHHTQQKSSSNNKQKRTISSSSSNSNSSMSVSGGGNKHKRLNNELISIELKPKGGGPVTAGSINSLNSIIVVDSFDDVIVEEHEDEEHTQVSAAVVDTKNNENIPKMLDMQIYQQHDGVLGDPKSQISVIGNQQQQSSLKTTSTAKPQPQPQQKGQIVQLTPPEEQRRYQVTTENEVDAGFDETIVTEIDENTAIEFIQDDSVVNMTTGSTMPATTTVTVVSDKLDQPNVVKQSTTESEHSKKVHSGSDINDGELKDANKETNDSNRRSSINHSDNVRNSLDVVQDTLPQQETIANNSGKVEQVEL